MPRIRCIRPEFWANAQVAKLSFAARLLFIALWNFADDYGCNRCGSKEISGFAFPDEAIDIEPLLDELEAQDLIHRYAVGHRSYYHVPTWSKHQKVDRPSKSRLPAPAPHCPVCQQAKGRREKVRSERRDAKDELIEHLQHQIDVLKAELDSGDRPTLDEALGDTLDETIDDTLADGLDETFVEPLVELDEPSARPSSNGGLEKSALRSSNDAFERPVLRVVENPRRALTEGVDEASSRKVCKEDLNILKRSTSTIARAHAHEANQADDAVETLDKSGNNPIEEVADWFAAKRGRGLILRPTELVHVRRSLELANGDVAFVKAIAERVLQEKRSDVTFAYVARVVESELQRRALLSAPLARAPSSGPSPPAAGLKPRITDRAHWDILQTLEAFDPDAWENGREWAERMNGEAS